MVHLNSSFKELDCRSAMNCGNWSGLWFWGVVQFSKFSAKFAWAMTCIRFLKFSFCFITWLFAVSDYNFDCLQKICLSVWWLSYIRIKSLFFLLAGYFHLFFQNHLRDYLCVRTGSVWYLCLFWGSTIFQKIARLRGFYSESTTIWWLCRCLCLLLSSRWFRTKNWLSSQ